MSTQDEYLEVEYYQESMADLEWELYVSSLLAEDDLNMLIEEILEFENAETILGSNFNREG